MHLRAYLDAQCVYGSGSRERATTSRKGLESGISPGLFAVVPQKTETCPRILHRLLTHSLSNRRCLIRSLTRSPTGQAASTALPTLPRPRLLSELSCHLHRPATPHRGTARGIQADTSRCRPRRGETDHRRCLCVEGFCDIQGWGSDGTRVEWQRTREGRCVRDRANGYFVTATHLV